MSFLNFRVGFKKTDTLFGMKSIAFLEIIGFLIITIATSWLFYAGDRFINVSPHPFTIILLLIIVQYGRNEALVCVFLMTLFLYTGNLPEQEIGQTIYDYWLVVAIRPVTWVAAATILGGLRMRSIQQEKELKESLDMAVREAETITDSYHKLQKINGELESRLAGELSSALKIYETAKLLENPDISFRMEALNNVVLSIMNPRKFSLYSLESEGLRIMSRYGWDEFDTFRDMFRKDEELYKKIIVDKKILCAVNESDEIALSHEGVIAGAIIDASSGEVFGMLKFEDIPFQALSMKNIRIFRILCEWIGITFHNARKLEQAESESLIDYEHMLYSYNFLNCQTEYMLLIAKYFNFSLFKLGAKVSNYDQLEEEGQRNASLCLGEAIRMGIREVDQAFDEQSKGAEFAVLMPGVSEKECEKIIDKVKVNIEESWFNEERANYDFSVTPLYKCEK